MYERDGIIYAGECNEGLLVSGCRYTGDRIFLVEFSTGETRLFDATCLLGMPAFKRLEDSAVLSAFQVEDGILSWANGEIDIAPEGLYSRSYEYESVA